MAYTTARRVRRWPGAHRGGTDSVNVVLIALDTQRADRLGCYGCPQPGISPFIDSLARRGVLFERAYAPNIPTHPSFTTMLTGKEAITHNIVNIGGKVPIAEGVRLLPEMLKEHGYFTAAVDNMGRHFMRGFDIYQKYQWDRSNPRVLRKAETVTAAALPVIDRIKAEGKPFFMFIHYWDPHTPYLPPPPYNRRYYPRDRDPYDPNNHSMDPVWAFEPFKWYFYSWMAGVTDIKYPVALYEGEVAYMDRHLRPVFERFADHGLLDETVFIITADHGEVLDEHEGYFDHHGLYECNVRVPLIFYAPKLLPRGRRVPGFVQNLDLVPTILDLLNVPDRDCVEGKSLLPCIFGLRQGNYHEVYLSEATWQVKRGLRTFKWKFIQALEPSFHAGSPMQELYDLENDPDEQHNLAEARPDVVQELSARLQAWVERRLQETGRAVDPCKEQGVCATRIGKPPVPGEEQVRGRRRRREAATIPPPEALNAPEK
ncbi:MAG: sulfatase [Chloroflexota bacterium]